MVNSEIMRLLVMKQHMISFRRIIDQAATDPKLLHAADHPLVTREESQEALRDVCRMLRADLTQRMRELDECYQRMQDALHD